MNFIFDSCFFGTNNIYIQNNNTFILPERTPFSDITQKMKNFFNTRKNQSFNSFSMNFNDIPNETKDFQFLKKKSHGDVMTSFKENEENIEPQESSNKSSKYLNNFYKKSFNNNNNNNNSSLNNLDEDKEESDKENLSYINNEINNNNNENVIDINQILNDTIKEKKENDKIERDRKKANKIRQMKLSLKNRKNALDYSNKRNEENKENICDHRNLNNIGLFESGNKKEINMMNIE